MRDQSVTPTDFTSETYCAGLARAVLRARRWIAGCRRHESLPDLSDWILRDIGVIRERDIGIARQAAPREEVRQFWLR